MTVRPLHLRAVPTPAVVAAASLAAAMLAIAPGAADAQTPEDDKAAVAVVLDDFHDAASDADYERYFGHFAEGAVFIGTDASEHWTVEEFSGYAKPHFDAGRGWTYVPTTRHVYLAPGGATAWFDELLDNASYGVTRGTGVLVKEDGRWKVAQYHLTIPVPNALARQVVEMIRERGGQGP